LNLVIKNKTEHDYITAARRTRLCERLPRRHYSEVYPTSRKTRRLKRLFKQFSFPGAFESRRAETPVRFMKAANWLFAVARIRAAFDNPDCSSRASWAMAKRRPVRSHELALNNFSIRHDGACCHSALNGYKIAGPPYWRAFR